MLDRTMKRRDNDMAAEAVSVVRILQEAGFTAYWAGGCVRDMLMDRPPADYDIATSADPAKVETLFPHAILTGKSFGVARVSVPGGRYAFEVATFRQDHSYIDGRRPTAVTFTDAATDARRRDFTINALFYDPEEDTLHDHVGGQADIAARLIRAVGNPNERFAEDHLRLLRAVRFSSTLDFPLAPQTAAAVRRNAHRVAGISAERVRQELSRILLESPRAGAAVRLMDELELLNPLLPELSKLKGQAQPPQFHPEGDVFTHTLIMLDRMTNPSLCLAYAILLHDVGKPPTAMRDPTGRIRFNRHAEKGAHIARAVLRRLRFPNRLVDAISYCVGNHMRFMDAPKMRPATLRRLISAPTFEDELELHRLDCLASHGKLDNYEFLLNARAGFHNEPVMPPPWITGRDIQALGIQQGAKVGVLKRTAYEAQLNGQFENRDTLLQWLRKHVQESA